MSVKENDFLVFGAGKSGVSSAKLLLDAGKNVCIYDGRNDFDFEKLKNDNPALKDCECYAGELPDKKFDCAVVSPGISLENKDIEVLKARGIEIWGEIELAYRFSKGEIYAITGTNGKTTTTSLTGKILGDWFKSVFVVGNIGDPFTEEVLKTKDDSKIALEISSFQLEGVTTFKPKASAILNITPDHLDRHHTMENYIRIKESITKNQTEEDTVVLNYEDETLRTFGLGLKNKVIFFSGKRELDHGIYYRNGALYSTLSGKEEKIIDTDELQILGVHNYENAAAAVALSLTAGVPMDSIRKSLREFKPVPYRIEFFAEKKGVKYYDDSKGTNPDASVKAVLAMNRPIVLIGGGYDKKISYDSYVSAFKGRVKNFVIIGETKDQLKETCQRLGFKDYCLADSLEEAVKISAGLAQEGDCVLLSPASASWDMFKNYEQRGDLFKEYVRKLPDD